VAAVVGFAADDLGLPGHHCALFNKFTPLKNRSVQTRIQAPAARTGFVAAAYSLRNGSRARRTVTPTSPASAQQACVL
jgi:hypothetical protein